MHGFMFIKGFVTMRTVLFVLSDKSTSSAAFSITSSTVASEVQTRTQPVELYCLHKLAG